MTINWQPSMLDMDQATTFDPTLGGRQRLRLDDTSWLDLLPNWIHGGDALLDVLISTAPWLAQRTRQMWDTTVSEPRIVAHWPDLATLPPVVDLMRVAVSTAYDTDFDHVAVNLYRDGRDSVTWHGDRVGQTHTCPLVVTISLGARRSFRVRPANGGGPVFAAQLGAGDLLIMGGRCQHDFVHAVPKERKPTGARLSLTFRHSGATPLQSPTPEGVQGTSAVAKPMSSPLR